MSSACRVGAREGREPARLRRLPRKAGGNFVDTANLYSGVRSETFLGEFLAEDRERIVLATKYTGATRSRDINASGNNRKNMMDSVHASLKRLNTDYIDLYWVHARDYTTPIEEVMRGLDDLVRQGKILYAGISDTPHGRSRARNCSRSCASGRRFVGSDQVQPPTVRSSAPLPRWRARSSRGDALGHARSGSSRASTPRRDGRRAGLRKPLRHGAPRDRRGVDTGAEKIGRPRAGRAQLGRQRPA